MNSKCVCARGYSGPNCNIGKDNIAFNNKSFPLSFEGKRARARIYQCKITPINFRQMIIMYARYCLIKMAGYWPRGSSFPLG